MQFDESNDFTFNREQRWHEVWLPCKAARNDSGFRDFSVHDYAPFTSLENHLDRYIDYYRTSAIYRNNLYAPVYVVASYLALILVGQRCMRDRRPLDLRTCLACWNLFLAVFSLCGTLRFVPHLVYGHAINPASYFSCRNGFGMNFQQAPIYLWLVLFVWSKYAELLDTAFLVLQKKPVPFLHWFHHASVLVYTWHAMAHQTAMGIYFASLNYLEHAVLYTYYFASAAGWRPKWGVGVTLLQVTLMFAGVAANVFQYYSYFLYPNCDVAWRNIYVSLVLYTVYMGLFLQHFAQRYCTSTAQPTLASQRRSSPNIAAASAKKRD